MYFWHSVLVGRVHEEPSLPFLQQVLFFCLANTPFIQDTGQQLPMEGSLNLKVYSLLHYLYDSRL